MVRSALDDKEKEPDPRQLAAVLGPAHQPWTTLIDHLASEYPPLLEEWSFAGKKWGWSLRLKQKKRTILYMTPSVGFFYVGFVLGERATNTAMESPLPADVLSVIEAAPKYAEGRGFRLEVPSHTDVSSIQLLAAIKMAN